MIINLKHNIANTVFYSLYGHLKTPHTVHRGQIVKAGAPIAQIGAYSDSGGWFSHLHLQMHTQASIDKGYMLKGYATEKETPHIEEYWPSPYPLFRW